FFPPPSPPPPPPPPPLHDALPISLTDPPVGVVFAPPPQAITKIATTLLLLTHEPIVLVREEYVERRERAVALRHVLLHLHLLFRSEEHTSELQSLTNLVCRLLLEK